MINLTLSETINQQRVFLLMNSNHLTDEEVKMLKQYAKKIKGDTIDVVLKQNLEMGRRYAEHGLSKQMFSKKIRPSLVYGTHSDIDIVNFHLVLICQC